MSTYFANQDEIAVPLHVVEAAALDETLERFDAQTRNWANQQGFTGALGQVLSVPDAHGGIALAFAGWGDALARARGRLWMGQIAARLPEGVYQIASGLDGDAMEHAALAWGLDSYRFDRYRKQSAQKARLKLPSSIPVTPIENLIAGDFLARDLINTPANDMGPDALQDAVQDLAKTFHAKFDVIIGDALLEQNFPLIHAVGRASAQAPRLLKLHWGQEDWPKITLVGKGVCFDTGGLNLKLGNSMGLMKKDMGGSANVLALARMIMGAGLKIQLSVLIPAVENAVSSNAFRPGDILTSRAGKTVEINNTDAEGRLVLADALSYACESQPEMIICKATLTGAARVAFGADIAPFFTDDEDLAKDLSTAAQESADPVWRMPFWAPYENDIEPNIADLDNAPAGFMAGAITAALFLRCFTGDIPFVHLDLYGWTPKPMPARSKGGACQSARALFSVLEKRYG